MGTMSFHASNGSFISSGNGKGFWSKHRDDINYNQLETGVISSTLVGKISSPPALFYEYHAPDPQYEYHAPDPQHAYHSPDQQYAFHALDPQYSITGSNNASYSLDPREYDARFNPRH
ncbi:Uncharacterized protein Adt_15103 [Abeliophyllum distichum]|uniref:Uncharacterized protein n=1 Tax=Abeliophyllum distichum TaxID=126358 RepID=A0ABD1U1J3_9LAMI